MKIVLIVGTGSSGSGAISDFLTKSTKYKNPFKIVNLKSFLCSFTTNIGLLD